MSRQRRIHVELTWFLAGVGSGIVIMAAWHMLKSRMQHRHKRDTHRD